MTTDAQRTAVLPIVVATTVLAFAGLALSTSRREVHSAPLLVDGARPDLATAPATKRADSNVAGAMVPSADRAAADEQVTLRDLAGVLALHGLHMQPPFNPLSPADWGRLYVSYRTNLWVPIKSPDSDVRTRQLIFQSEDLRHVPEIWERAWGMKVPDVASPYRVNGEVN